MTRDRRVLSRWHQIRWWFTLPASFHPFVLDQVGKIGGYGLVVIDGEKAWLTGGLVPDIRGRGLGEQLFSHLVRFAEAQGLSPWLEVLETNHAGLRLYRRLGFVERYQHGDTITMEMPLH